MLKRINFVVAQKLEYAAVKIIRTGFRRQVDDTPIEASKLC